MNSNVSALQDLTCGLAMNFIPEQNSFFQILFNGTDHWCVVSEVSLDFHIGFDPDYEFN